MPKIIISFIGKGSLEFNYLEPDEPKIKALLEMCYKNIKAVKLLANLASNYDELSIYFTDESLVTKGFWYPQKCKIKIKNSLLPDDLLQTFIFECCNALNPKFTNLNYESFFNDKQYSTFMEKSEYQSYQLRSVDNSHWQPQITACQSHH